jgi:hypothetical protein
MEKSFIVDSEVVLNLNVIIGKVTINSVVSQDTLTIQAKSDDKTLSELEIYQNGNEIAVKGPRNAGMIISDNGNVISNFSGDTISVGNVMVTNSGQNIAIINGIVWINGKRVDNDSNDSTDTREPLELIINIPRWLVPDLILEQVQELLCNVSVDEVSLDTSGQCSLVFQKVGSFSGDTSGKIKIQANEVTSGLNLDISGQTIIRVLSFKGELKLDGSGQSKVTCRGSFSTIKVDISGTSNVDTNGSVSGNLSVNVSGVSTYTHNGKVAGRVKERKSGIASISISQ